MRFPDRLRLPLAFDPIALVHDLDALASAEWTDHFVKQNYAGNWSAIPLRAKAGARHPIMMIASDPTATQFEDTPQLHSCPYFREVLSRFRCPLRTVRLMRLTPGSRIHEHTDLDLGFEDGTVRLHVPIVTNPCVSFLLNGSPVVMRPGTAWYLRLSDPHSAANDGDCDRVHLVIDAIADEWTRDLLAAAATEQQAALAG
jgi:hypothetical protein